MAFGRTSNVTPEEGASNDSTEAPFDAQKNAGKGKETEKPKESFYRPEGAKPIEEPAEGGKKSDARHQAANADAREKLNNLEQNNLNVNRQPNTGIDQAKNYENGSANNAPFLNSVTGKKPQQPKDLKSFIKRRMPIMVVVLLIGGVGGAIVGMQSMMAVSLLEQFKTKFDSISVANTRRSDRIFISQLNRSGYKSTVQASLFGLKENKFKVTNKQRNRLATQGMYVVDDFNGSGKSVTLFDNGSGNLKIVTADSTQTSLFTGKDISFDSIKSQLPSNYSGPTTIDTTDVVDHRTRFSLDSDYRNGTQKATRTWRRSVGAWFDSVTANFLSKHRLTRNIFKNFIARVQDEDAGNTKQRVIDIMAQNNEDADAGLAGTNKTTSEQEDEEGNKKIISTTNEDGQTEESVLRATKLKGTISEKRAAARKYLNDFNQKNSARAASIFSMVTNIGCAALNMVGGFELLAAAKQGAQLLGLAMGFGEGVDKSKVDPNSPGATMNNSLSEKRYTEIETGTGSDDADGLPGTTTTTSDQARDAMSSASVRSMYTGDKIDPNDPSVATFNSSSNLKGALGSVVSHIANATVAFTGCAVAKIVASLAGATLDGFKIAGCIMSFGIGCIIDAAIDSAEAIAGAEVKKWVTSAVVNAVTPFMVGLLVRDLISDLGGEHYGNALFSGFHMAMGQNHLSGGGALATYTKYLTFAAEQEKVIAEEAEYQRATRSPFDASSEYTFLGSLVKQVITLSTTTGTPTNILSTIGTMTRNSALSLLPGATASAVNEVGSDLLTEEEFADACPTLASIGAYGDSFCNPYIISDPSTFEMEPGDVIDKVASLDNNFDSDGKIKEGSDLSNFILHCNQRSSTFGVYDNNIADSFLPGASKSTLVSVIPVIGDLADAFGSEEQIRNIDWITGQACVAGTTGTVATDTSSEWTIENKDWKNTKYYQRYVEDQRLAESMDDGYVSNVTAFLDEYYTKNPLDTSYEGTLARNTGLTKDQVIALLDQQEYLDLVASYDPSTRFDFTVRADEPSFEETYDLDDSSVVSNNPLISLLQMPISYDDLRSRAVALG